MNNLGPSSTQNNFDFTQPPPGYSIQGFGASKKFESTHAETRPAYYEPLNKAVAGYITKEVSGTIDSRYAYCQVPSGDTKVYKSRSTILTLDSSYRNRFPNQEPKDAFDPRIYALAPPPPPSEPYPANIAMPLGHYVFNPAVYSAYSVPPPMITGSTGAGQYVTHQQEIYRPRQYQREYNSGYSNRGGYYSHIIRKRKMPQEVEQNGSKKMSKKKKKPLSQNIPSRKDWSVEDARRALEVEREFNKRHKSQPLIIKFPDLELNRDIVSKFHPKIDSVHFQQPSTPRFCFVTLKDSANMEEVIKELNKIKFGDGYLTAEPKKDREEDFNIGPEDIDPLNLYVGNLAQEVTVDDVVKAYPKNKRIDIGFAKKMKYTRYAFVCFRTVDDAIEAFQNTHATEMYNKSLIVRFRRLHGTVGLPGEPKPQNHQKRSEDHSSLSEPNENPYDANSTKDDNSAYNLANCPLPLKKELPKNLFYNYGSDDDEEDEEELHYSNNIRNLVFNSLGTNAATNVKNEPLDYEGENYFKLYEPTEEKPHVPIIEIKTERDLKPPIIIKKEEQEWDEKDHYDNTPFSATRRSSSDSFDEGGYDLRNNDPLIGAFARASEFKV